MTDYAGKNNLQIEYFTFLNRWARRRQILTSKVDPRTDKVDNLYWP